MERIPTEDCMRRLVHEVVRAGFVLGGLIRDLSESLPEDAYPGESNVDVVFEMMAGSLRPVAASFGEQRVYEALELLSESQDRILMDLRLAAELAKRREQMAGSEEPLN
jgi:hypothetical protein